MPVSRIAKTNTILGILSLGLLPVSALGTQLGLFHFRIGLLLFLLAALIGLVVVVIAALRTRKQSDEPSRRQLSRTALLALPAIAAFGFTALSGGDAPLIHNVTTAPDKPPQFIVASAKRGSDANPLSYSAETAKLQKAGYPELRTLNSSLTPALAFKRALTLCEELGWEVYFQDESMGHIEAVATTRWFNFKDDIVVRVQASATGSAIDLRSVSRVGKGDLGANARRIEKFISVFTDEN
ncbi:MAG: hypothetical protein ACI89D_002694 [Bermanella sp.]|jgi:hypothetical protein